MIQLPLLSLTVFAYGFGNSVAQPALVREHHSRTEPRLAGSLASATYFAPPF